MFSHQGVYVVQDNTFKPLLRISSPQGSAEALKQSKVVSTDFVNSGERDSVDLISVLLASRYPKWNYPRSPDTFGSARDRSARSHDITAM